MKLSISLPDEQVEAIDRYAQATGARSRSQVIQEALRSLTDPQLEGDYTAAWEEWEASGDAEAWEVASADGLSDAAR